MPSWIPGSYLLREFARHVLAIEADSGGRQIPIRKIDKSSWVCEGAAGPLRVRATVYALDRSVRGAYLDGRRGFFNGTCVFLLPEGHERAAVELRLVRPTDPRCARWRVATAMTPVAADAEGFGTYHADDYDELIDHPFEISDFQAVDFEAGGVPHELVVAGQAETDLERVAHDLRQLCETQIDFFGRPAPFGRYVFLGLAVGDGYGGLEHRASSSLIFRRADLPRPGEPGIPREYQRFLGLASHEYFHAWHVKRSRPAAFVPYRFDRRNHTRLLWVFEGITSYYQERFLLTSGLLGVDAYLRRLAEQLTRVFRVPGRFRQSLAESSFDAWDSLYKPGPNSANAGVSYYSKGALVALALDLHLRRDARCTLDDVVRALWQRYGARDEGLPEEGFEALAAEVSGLDLREFFDTSVRGTSDPDLAGLLSDFGVRLGLRPAEGPKDTGGTPPTTPGSPAVSLGAAWSARDGGIGLDVVLDGGAADGAGLCPGDAVIALDGLRIDANNLAARLARYVPGDSVAVAFFREDELLDTRLTFAAATADTCYLHLDPEAGRKAISRRHAWLGE